MGYSPWGHKELDMTERLSTEQHTCLSFPLEKDIFFNVLQCKQTLSKEESKISLYLLLGKVNESVPLAINVSLSPRAVFLYKHF